MAEANEQWTNEHLKETVVKQPISERYGALEQRSYEQRNYEQYGLGDRPSVVGCPRGLEYLVELDQVIVKQMVELAEVFCGCHFNNKYQMMNTFGQQCYFAREETGFCMRYWCKQARGFVIHITDNNDEEVMRIERKFKCCTGCCWCATGGHCSFKVEVQAPVGQVVGYVIQGQSKWKPKYSLYTADMEEIAHIGGPCCVCHCPCCGDVEFPVYSPDETTEIGKVSKHWTGAIKEIFTNADTFNVTFPKDMDVRMKAVMIGALFLIDFMFFENQDN